MKIIVFINLPARK